MAQYAAYIMTQQAIDDINEQMTISPSWVNEDNIAVYEMNIPNRVVRQNYSGNENNLAKCSDREYKPLLNGQNKIIINNRKTNIALDIRPVHLPEYQMWAYAPVYAPLPLVKETCGRPEKY